MKAIAIIFAVVLPMMIVSNAFAAEPNFPEPPYSVEQLRAWHKTMDPWPWLGEPEQKVNLRSRKNNELLLAISGNSRGSTFVLFAKIKGKWTQISDEIEQAHHPLNILRKSKNGWRDFETYVPAGGSGGAEVWVFTYAWNGKKYVQKNQRDAKWCEVGIGGGEDGVCPAKK
jgi:hypothetical protein